MTLIAIALALLAERALSHLKRWREYDWFGRYLEWLHGRPVLEPLWLSAGGVLVLVPPVLLVAIVQGSLHGGPLSLMGLVFAAAVLVFSLGPRDLWEEIHALESALQRGDREEADALTRDLCTAAGRQPSNADGRAVVRAALIQGHERVFGILLWFFVLGPMGAVLYRTAADLTGRLRDKEVGEECIQTAETLHGVLAWVPARLVALLYGLAGSTEHALERWRESRDSSEGDWVRYTWRLLAQTGFGALQMEEGTDHHRVRQGLGDTLREARGLLTRTLFILLAALAAFTIGGWIA